MLDAWNSVTTCVPALPPLQEWLPPSLAPQVREISNADYAGWTSSRSWDAPPKVFVYTGTDQTDELIELLDRLGSLPPNWNGHGGITPAADAIEQAKQFYGLLSSNWPAPSIEPSGDGEVNLVWRVEGKYLELGFYGDGTLSYYGKLDGREILGDFAQLPAVLPKELRIALLAFSDGRV